MSFITSGEIILIDDGMHYHSLISLPHLILFLSEIHLQNADFHSINSIWIDYTTSFEVHISVNIASFGKFDIVVLKHNFSHVKDFWSILLYINHWQNKQNICQLMIACTIYWAYSFFFYFSDLALVLINQKMCNKLKHYSNLAFTMNKYL